MKRLVLLLAVFAGLALSSVSLFAADLPVVRQPNDPAFSAADRSALSAAWTAIEKLLRPGYPLTRVVQLSGRQWVEVDYVQFAAGVIQSAGYAVSLATGSFAGAPRTWILAGVPVSLGMAYIPVEAAPSLLPSSSWIGRIAWQGGVSGTSFDSRYFAFAEALPLPANTAAAFVVSDSPYVVVDETATLQVLGMDPDGGILFCFWSLGDGTEEAKPGNILWHTFREVGQVPVAVSVFDMRGGRVDLSITVDVLAEKPDCGCGH